MAGYWPLKVPFLRLFIHRGEIEVPKLTQNKTVTGFVSSCLQN